jgi:hypothetical protein
LTFFGVQAQSNQRLRPMALLNRWHINDDNSENRPGPIRRRGGAAAMTVMSKDTVDSAFGSLGF